MKIKTKHYELENKLISTLFNLFNKEFCQILTIAENDEIEELFKISHSMFKKWLYSTFAEDTPLTPINIIRNFCKSELMFSIDVSYNEQKFFCSLKKHELSLNDDFFIKDIKYICDKCFPAGDYDFFSYENSSLIISNFKDVFINDFYYISYIAELALSIGLLSKMPSINTTKYQKNEIECNKFFSLDNIEQFKILLNCAVELFIKKVSLKTGIALPNSSTKTIIKILSSEYLFDPLFRYIYSIIGIDIDNILENINQDTEKELSDEEEFAASSTLYLNVLIDRWLVTPLGHYMGILTPCYFESYYFIEDYDFVKPILTTNCDPSLELFLTPNYFTLTKKGAKILNTSPNENDNISMNKEITYEEANNLINLYQIILSTMDKKTNDDFKPTNVYRLKITFKKNKDMWKILDIPVDITLRQLKYEINSYLGLNLDKHSFKYLNNEFILNTKLKHIRSFVEMPKNDNIIEYTNCFEHDLDIEISFLGTIKSEERIIYPRLVRQSRNITKYEREYDF